MKAQPLSKTFHGDDAGISDAAVEAARAERRTVFKASEAAKAELDAFEDLYRSTPEKKLADSPLAQDYIRKAMVKKLFAAQIAGAIEIADTLILNLKDNVYGSTPKGCTRVVVPEIILPPRPSIPVA